ncbi:MAG: LysM peptidoglycan-binding domain-containing protein [Candidatus Promineifilaceae bacterium]
MNTGVVPLRNLAFLGGMLLVLVIAAGCGSDEDATPSSTEAATAVVVTISTPVELVVSPQPIASSTPVEIEPTAVQPTVTSPVPTRTPQPTATPTPTPPPAPITYTVESGDTLIGIAESFSVSIESLALANGSGSPAELSIIVGQELQIPLCEVHQVVAGNTLAGIALSCGISLDNLVTANISDLAQLGSLDAIPLGFILFIPPESVIPDQPDCDPLPGREQVIEYPPGAGEGIFCLSLKYDVSTTTLLRANTERLVDDEPYGSVPLLIPPFDGALYSISAEDIENGISLGDLAAWYEAEVEAITDWNINGIAEPLIVGQQLLIAGANLAIGPFRFQQPE